MGQIQITRRSFSLSGSQLHIQMEVNYEGLQMPSDESLTLTPFLLAGEQSFDLPSILINGAEKQKVYERTRVLGGASDARNGRNSTPSVGDCSVQGVDGTGRPHAAYRRVRL